jgi:hypothetical protein
MKDDEFFTFLFAIKMQQSPNKIHFLATFLFFQNYFQGYIIFHAILRYGILNFKEILLCFSKSMGLMPLSNGECCWWYWQV